MLQPGMILFCLGILFHQAQSFLPHGVHQHIRPDDFHTSSQGDDPPKELFTCNDGNTGAKMGFVNGN